MFKYTRRTEPSRFIFISNMYILYKYIVYKHIVYTSFNTGDKGRKTKETKLQ